MPSLPVYQSQKNVNIRKSAPAQQITEPTFKTDTTLQNALMDIAQEWSNVHDFAQEAESKNKYEMAVAQIQTEALNDPNYKDSDKYYKALEKAKNESLMGIDNQQLASRLSYEMDSSNMVAGVKINANFKEKEIAQAVLDLDNSLDILTNQKIAASPSEMKLIDSKIDDYLNRAVSSGIINGKEAKQKREQMEKATVLNAINVDPDNAEAMLTSGKFIHLSPDDRVNMLKLVDAKKAANARENQKFYASQKLETEDVLQQKNFDETLSLTDLEEAAMVPESEGGADRKLLDSYKGVLFKKVKDRQDLYIGEKYPESKKYIDAINEVLDKESDLTKARKILVDYFADGKISKEEGQVLDAMLNMMDNIRVSKMNYIEKSAHATRRMAQVGFDITLPFAWQKLKEFQKVGYSSKVPIEDQAADLQLFLNEAYKREYPPDKIFEDIRKKRQEKNYPQYIGWEVDQIREDPVLGPVKVLKIDEDGMPIVEVK